MKRFLTLMLVCIFALSAFCSCVSVEPPVNVTVKFVTEDDTVFNQKIECTPVDGKVTVIQAVNEAVAQFSLNNMIVVGSNGYSITKAGIYKEGNIDGAQYFWMYDINGVEPESGRANTNTVVDGDVITYTFYCSMKNPNATEGNDDPITVKYNSEMGVFTEEEETEAEEAEEGEEGEEEAAE